MQMLYERMVFPKNLDYRIFWPIAISIVFLAEEIIINHYGKTEYSFARGLLLFTLMLTIVFIIFVADAFRRALKELAEVMEFSDERKLSWPKEKFALIFGYKNRLLLISIPIIAAAFTIPLVFVRLPFNSPHERFFWIASVFIASVIGGHGALGVVQTQRFLHQIARKNMRFPFFTFEHPAINSVNSFYVWLSFLTLTIYTFVIFVMTNSPAGINNFMITVLTFLSLYPLGMFILTYYQIYKMKERIKKNHLNTISQKIQDQYNFVLNSQSPENIITLKELMEIQSMVEKMSLFSTSFGNVITLVLTIVLPIAQSIL